MPESTDERVAMLRARLMAIAAQVEALDAELAEQAAAPGASSDRVVRIAGANARDGAAIRSTRGASHIAWHLSQRRCALKTAFERTHRALGEALLDHFMIACASLAKGERIAIASGDNYRIGQGTEMNYTYRVSCVGALGDWPDLAAEAARRLGVQHVLRQLQMLH